MNDKLEHEHTPTAIAARIQQNHELSSLGDFVLGAVDGTITTFAIVAGVAGAGMPASIAVVLGLANVLADGFSMAVGNYLKARSDRLIVERYRRIEQRHIDRTPEGEREEVRQIYQAKGFEGEILEEIVDTITSDRDRWIDTMLVGEFGLQLQTPNPYRAGLTTFFGFVIAGMVPIVPLFFSNVLSPTATFAASAIGASITFILIGAIRGRLTDNRLLAGAIETLLVGGSAATMAYVVGWLLKSLVISN